MQNRYCRAILALCCVALAGELACRDSTAPDPNATLFGRVRGTYELSVVLNSHTYSDSCQPISLDNPVQKCHDTTVAVSGRRVHAFVTLADTIAASTITTSTADMFFQVPAGTVTLTTCDSCSSSAIPYPAAIATVGRDSLAFEVELEPAGFLMLQGRIANGEITGHAETATYLGCCWNDYYTGTFVAKRQP